MKLRNRKVIGTSSCDSSSSSPIPSNAHQDGEDSYRPISTDVSDVSSVSLPCESAASDLSSAECTLSTIHGRRKWSYAENKELMYCVMAKDITND